MIRGGRHWYKGPLETLARENLEIYTTTNNSLDKALEDALLS